MTIRVASRLAAGAFVAALAFAVGTVGIAPAVAQTQGQTQAQGQSQGQGKAKSAANTQRAKKPGQSCDKLDKATKAYSDCVKAQAQSEKKPKPPEGTKAAEKAKKKG